MNQVLFYRHASSGGIKSRWAMRLMTKQYLRRVNKGTAVRHDAAGQQQHSLCVLADTKVCLALSLFATPSAR